MHEALTGRWVCAAHKSKRLDAVRHFLTTQILLIEQIARSGTPLPYRRPRTKSVVLEILGMSFLDPVDRRVFHEITSLAWVAAHPRILQIDKIPSKQFGQSPRDDSKL